MSTGYRGREGGRTSNHVWPSAGVSRNPPTPRQCRAARRSAHATPPYIHAIARTIARGVTEQAIGHPDREALTKAVQAIWRGIEVLEGMDRRARPSAARSVRRGRCQRHRSPLAD